MCFVFFPLHLSKVLGLPRKIDARSYEVLHLSRKIISANLKIWCSKMQPLSGNQRSDLLTSLMNMSLVLRLPRKMHLCRSSSNVPRLPSFLEMLQNPHVLLTFDKVHNPLRLPRETRSECPKVVVCSKCASHHNGVHFFDILTSKSGPELVCFVHFDFEMCFAPHRRALFRHLNFQKWSDPGVLCTFWLRNVLRATTACTFSTSQLPKVVRTWGVFSFFTYKCASDHNGRFSDHKTHQDVQNHWKNTVFRDFPTFSCTCIFLLLTLSLLWSSLFCSSLLSASAHLCFSSVHIVGSLTSKLPSIIYFSAGAGTKAVMSKSRRFRSFAISIYMLLEHVKQWLLIWTSTSIHLHGIKNRGTSWSAVCCPLFVFKVRKEFPQNILVFGLLRAVCFFRFCSSLLILKIKVIFTLVSFKARLDHPK